jgi:hypothetical protein
LLYVKYSNCPLATTADIYGHIRNKTKQKALDKLGGIIKVDLSETPVKRPRRVAGK